MECRPLHREEERCEHVRVVDRRHVSGNDIRDRSENGWRVEVQSPKSRSEEDELKCGESAQIELTRRDFLHYSHPRCVEKSEVAQTVGYRLPEPADWRVLDLSNSLNQDGHQVVKELGIGYLHTRHCV